MIKLKYKAKADKESVIMSSYNIKLNFENNSKLDITKKAKIVEAFSHNEDRVTLLYQNLGSFTFVLNKQKDISEPQNFYVKYGEDDSEVRIFLQLDRYYNSEAKRVCYKLIDRKYGELSINFDPLDKNHK